MYCYVCRKAGQDIAGKTKFVTGKKLKRESPVCGIRKKPFHNSVSSASFRQGFG